MSSLPSPLSRRDVDNILALQRGTNRENREEQIRQMRIQRNIQNYEARRVTDAPLAQVGRDIMRHRAQSPGAPLPSALVQRRNDVNTARGYGITPDALARERTDQQLAQADVRLANAQADAAPSVLGAQAFRTRAEGVQAAATPFTTLMGERAKAGAVEAGVRGELAQTRMRSDTDLQLGRLNAETQRGIAEGNQRTQLGVANIGAGADRYAADQRLAAAQAAAQARSSGMAGLSALAGEGPQTFQAPAALMQRPASASIPAGAMTATGPDGRKAYSMDGGETWFDAETNEPL